MLFTQDYFNHHYDIYIYIYINTDLCFFFNLMNLYELKMPQKSCCVCARARSNTCARVRVCDVYIHRYKSINFIFISTAYFLHLLIFILFFF